MRIVTYLLCGLGLLGSLPVLAAPAEKESTYEVEVVVFENRLPEFVGDEMLSRTAGARLQNIDNVVIPEAAVSEPYLYPALSNLLEQDGHYRVLAHQHWQQTIDAKTIAKPVRIQGGNPAELDGTIRFYMSRYLHLDADLVFRQIATTPEQGVDITFRLTEQRKLKSQEIHYFDHPKFGMLVRIMPLEKGADPEKSSEKAKL